jgi:hypothetical protein
MTNEKNDLFYGNKLFESMEGFDYFVSQLTDYPEEERRDAALRLIFHIMNGFMV